MIKYRISFVLFLFVKKLFSFTLQKYCIFSIRNPPLAKFFGICVLLLAEKERLQGIHAGQKLGKGM
jgi:hypothetical protein